MAGHTVRTRAEPPGASAAGPMRPPRRRRRRPWALALAAALLLGSVASAGERAPTAAAPTRAAPDRREAAAAAPTAPAAILRMESIVLDFPRNTGAALIRRGASLLAVFDSPELRNPEALRRPSLAGSEVRTLPGGMVLTLPATLAPAVALTRGPSGWVLGPSRPSANGTGEAGAAEA